MTSSTQPSTSTPVTDNNASGISESEHKQKSSTQNPLPLPAPSTDPSTTTTTTIDMSAGGSTVKLDYLGPLVVNKDGTLSRIGNWAEMSNIERQNTLRILGKRNQLRREVLQGQESEAQK